MNLQNKIYSKSELELSKTLDILVSDYEEGKQQLREIKNQLACEYIQKGVDEVRELIDQLLDDNNLN